MVTIDGSGYFTKYGFVSLLCLLSIGASNGTTCHTIVGFITHEIVYPTIMVDRPIPKASIDTIREVIEGYYEAGKVGDLVEDEEVEEEVEASADVTRRQKRFLADFGILEKDGHDYRLRQEGNEVGRALAFEREDEAREQIREMLEAWEVTDELVEDIGQKEVNEVSVTDSIAYLTETDPSTPRKKTGLGALVDLYVWTGIMEKSGENSYQVSVIEDQPDNLEPESEAVQEDDADISENGEQALESESQNDRPVEDSQIPPSIQMTAESGDKGSTFSINMGLSGEEDPKNVKKLVIAVRQGLQADLEEPESNSGDGESEEFRTLSNYGD